MASSVRIDSHPKHLINSLRKHGACVERIGFQLGVIATTEPKTVEELWFSQVYVSDMAWFSEMLLSLSDTLMISPYARQQIELLRAIDKNVEQGRKRDGCFTREGRLLNDAAVVLIKRVIPDPIAAFSYGGRFSSNSMGTARNMPRTTVDAGSGSASQLG